MRKLVAGDIIGGFNVIRKNLRYTNSVCANSIMTVVAFPLQEIRAIVKVNQDLQGYLYKYCLPLISRLSPSLDIFGSFTNEDWTNFRKVLDYSRLQPY